MGKTWYVPGFLFALFMQACFPEAAFAQDFPQRPVRFVIPFPPGGATDGLARVLGEKMSEAWKQQVVIDNRGGAGGNIAAEIVARAPADGYTIIIVGLSHAANLSLYSKLGYDPVKDFAPVSQVVSINTYLVAHPSLPANSVKELLALATAHPGTINYASGGNGSSPHMAMELFKSLAKVDLVHVPYKGTLSVIGVLQGEASLLFENLISVGAHVKAGRLKALAVGASKRSAAMPEVPTVAEAGVAGYNMVLWFGVLAPAGTPKAVIAKLHGAIVNTLKMPDVKARLATQDADPIGSTPGDFDKFIKAEITKWGRVVKEARLKID